MEVTRRDMLVKGAAAAAVAGALGAEFAIAGDAQPGQSADIVIIGEGMGGLTAGMRAIDNGINNVVILEVSKWPGGGSSFSLGAAHANGMGSSEDMYKAATRYQSTSDLAVKSFLAINDVLDYIGNLDLPFTVTDPVDSDAKTAGASTDMKSGKMLNEDGESGLTGCINFFRAFEDLFVEKGGTVLHGVSGRKVKTDEDGNIVGVVCVDENGSLFTVATTQVVLATGGWQNDEEMKSRYLGHDAWQAGCMGVPYNTGSGIKMAQELGASLQGDFGHFAGLFLPALPAKNWMEDVEAYEANDYTFDEGGKWWLWMEIIDAIPTSAILVNNSGKRFVDEGRFRHSYEPAIAQQEHATGIIIMDSKCWDNWMNSSGWGMEEGCTQQDRMDVITSGMVGGAYFEADTLEELADKMNESGVATYAMHKTNLVTTIAEYNTAAAAGDGTVLTPKRETNPCNPIEVAPFYAVPIRNAIFATFGGLAIDEQARVLDVVRRPIPGLYATEPCAGGMMQEFYAGSIAHAAATGMWAADSAAKALGL